MVKTDSTANAFEPYARDVYGWAYRLLGRHDDALDVVQDVFIKWSRQCSNDAPRQPRGWLRRVTWNRAIDLVRRRRRDPQTVRSIPTTIGGIDSAPDQLDRDALRGDIGDALDGLSDAQRGVLVAKVYDDMTFSQIADEMDIAVSTAKTHYLRAVRHMRDRLRTRWLDGDRP